MVRRSIAIFMVLLILLKALQFFSLFEPYSGVCCYSFSFISIDLHYLAQKKRLM